MHALLTDEKCALRVLTPRMRNIILAPSLAS
jgi:hypothetical protein